MNIHLAADPDLVAAERPAYVEALCGVWIPGSMGRVHHGDVRKRDLCIECGLKYRMLLRGAHSGAGGSSLIIDSLDS